MKVHILYTPHNVQNGRLHEAVTFFLEQGDEVNILLPAQKTEIKQGDFLLLLDTGGINANTKAFLPHFPTPPDVPAQDQWFENFRQVNLDYYINKQKAVIIAEGYAALTLFGELGGKVWRGDHGYGYLTPMITPKYLPNNTDATSVGAEFSFKQGNKFYGMTSFTFDGKFYSAVNEFIGRSMKSPSSNPPLEAVEAI